MRCACGRSVVSWALELTERAAARVDRAVVVGLTGYPFMGKTRLAGELAAAWAPAPAAVLPTETVIAPRSRRLELAQDGSSARAHDVERLDDIVAAVVAGTSVTVGAYSWTAGRHTHTVTVPGLPGGGLLVVDGSVACEAPIARRCDLLIFFHPSDDGSWLEHAIRRDVLDRGWTGPAARRENRRKQVTVDDQRRRHADLVTSLVAVDAGSLDGWTAQVPDCAVCRRQPA